MPNFALASAILGPLFAVALVVLLARSRRRTARQGKVLMALQRMDPGWYVCETSLATDYGLDVGTLLAPLVVGGVLERRAFRLRLVEARDEVCDVDGSPRVFEAVGYRLNPDRRDEAARFSARWGHA